MQPPGAASLSASLPYAEIVGVLEGYALKLVAARPAAALTPE